MLYTFLQATEMALPRSLPLIHYLQFNYTLPRV